MLDRSLNAQLGYARSLVERRECDEAVDMCRRALAAFPRCVAAYEVLALAVLRNGSEEMAETLFSRVLSVSPDSVESAWGMAAIQRARGAFDVADQWLGRAADSAPEARAIPDWLTSQAGQYARSGEELSRAGLGILMLRSGMFERAQAELRGALADEPDRDDIRMALAIAAYRACDYAAASEVCLELLVKLPDCLKALLISGKLALDTEEDSRGRENLRRAQSLDPQNQVAQALFGEDSPLPPRTARVPARVQGDRLTLPYLVDELYEEAEEGNPPSLQDLL